MIEACHSWAIAASIFSCPAKIAEKKKIAYVAMIDTPVEDVITPTQNENAMRTAIALVGGGRVPAAMAGSLTALPFTSTAAFGLACFLTASWLFQRKDF